MKVAERSRVDLPAHVPDDFEVFVAGVRQARGVDYEVLGRSLVFPRPIEQEGRLLGDFVILDEKLLKFIDDQDDAGQGARARLAVGAGRLEQVAIAR